MALFSNEDILSWFCSTNPISQPPGDAKLLPDPGLGKAAAMEKLKAEAAEEEAQKEAAKQKQRNAVRTQHKSKPAQAGYYERMTRLIEANKLYDGDEYGGLEEEEIGPSRPFNPNAFPGDDDYDPRLSEAGNVYSQHDFMTNLTPPLPIAAYRDEIVHTVKDHSVTVIQGETGCGKSTQVAQYILDHHARKGVYCNIVCTQPRRIAATSIAKYVVECRGWEVGGMVGYQIGMDRRVSEDTRLTFVTTGVLLQKMVNMRNLNQYTHVILDEVHERDKDTDFCLLVVKKLLKTTSKHVKVVLMSATIEAPMFAQYFSTRGGGAHGLAPLVVVKGRTHHVMEFYLDDIKNLPSVTKCQPLEVDNPRITEDTMKVAYSLILLFEEIESSSPESRRGDFTRGTVLVFLPGMPEIREMEAVLEPGKARGWTILLLHSTISSEDQRRVFLKPSLGSRKIILATNIAESSITVPDIKYVIDFCLVKQLMCDWQTKYVCLKTVLASQASLTQRKGRAGRVSDGRCYRLITRAFYNRHIPEYSTPEMLRCPLESVVLKAKKLDFGEPRSLLGSALQPPKLDDIERAILNLKEVGALTVMYRGVVHPYNGDLTFVGEILETLPVDVRLGKLVILGHVFGCLEACIIIAAALSTRPILTSSFNQHLDAYKSKRAWAESSNSDCIAYLNAYKEWHRRQHLFQRSGNEEDSWCKRNKVSRRAMREVHEVVKELSNRLATRFHIRAPGPGVNREFESDPHNKLILKLVMCGAFYPHYFRWAPVDEEACQKAMSGHDALTTVVLSALPRNAHKYSDQICDLFRLCGRGKALHFEPFKVFVEFERPHPSHISPVQAVEPVLDSVYVALKRRHERNKLAIYIDDSADARVVGGARWKLPAPILESEEVECSHGNTGKPKGLKERTLPGPESSYQQIIITEYIDAGHFWAQLADRYATEKMRELQDSIRSHGQKLLTSAPVNMEDMFCLAPFSEDGLYYRAKILEVGLNVKKMQMCAKVVFVDYGNVEEVNTERLCELHPRDMELEMQAFECFLTAVKPSIQLSSDGKWFFEANLRFRQLTQGKYLVIKVFSVVDRKVRVELFDTNGEDDVLINEVLVVEGLAERCQEPYESKVAHAQAVEADATTGASGTGSKSKSGKPKPEYQSTVKTVEWTRDKSTYPRNRRVEIRGPDSMYEVTFHPLTIVGGYRQARIERDSINCFVVNNDSHDQHERLMVAGHVALNPSGNVCMARHTTLLPNIHGLIHLVTLLFAPCIEMRTDELKQQYIGAICGLGYDPETGESIYSEHDIELTFDTVVTQTDLKKINNLRLAINLAVGSDDAIGEMNESMLRKIQSKARELIKDLILKSRESVTPSQTVRQGWNKVAPGDILPASTTEFDDSPSLYPLHYGIDLHDCRSKQGENYH